MHLWFNYNGYEQTLTDLLHEFRRSRKLNLHSFFQGDTLNQAALDALCGWVNLKDVEFYGVILETEQLSNFLKARGRSLTRLHLSNDLDSSILRNVLTFATNLEEFGFGKGRISLSGFVALFESLKKLKRLSTEDGSFELMDLCSKYQVELEF